MMRPFRFLVAPLLLCYASRPVTAQQQSLQAKISWTGNSVRSGENFSLTTLLRNAGPSERSLTIYTCPVQVQWLPDNPVVHVVEVLACQQPALYVIRIKAGEEYEGTLTLFIRPPSERGSPKSVTFRIGFSKKAHFRKSAPNSSLIWSNAITVAVAR